MADVIDDRLTLPCKYSRYRPESVTSPTTEMSCRRCLFGQPDPDELQRDLEQRRERQARQDDQRWNFHFKSGRPMNGRYEWQAVITAVRGPESCGRLPPEADRSDDDQIGSDRLELVGTSTYTHQTAPSATTTPPQPEIAPALSGSSTAAVDAPHFLLPSGGAKRKRRRSSPQGDAGKRKQRRHSASRRTIARRRAQLVSTAGAARVTGQSPLL